ncbi:MAG TPA: YbhB/YbcL family Raf kinase inhibitor-like protein [Trueperaceae bacterium]
MGFALSDMKLTSSAFEQHGQIPRRHTAEGEDVSPPLSWSGAPESTRSFAIFCHDPDAPLVKPGSFGFTHWVLYGLPGSTTSLSEGTGEGRQGVNDFGGTGYGGPKPPVGHGTHHYYFWVMALDRELDFAPGLNLEQLLEKTERHVLGMNRLVGSYRID